MALSALLLFITLGVACVLALRSILYAQLDGTLLHLAEVEAEAGAAATGPDFEFHEGVLLASREGPAPELTRYAQLWASDGDPLVRTRNLTGDLDLPSEALSAAQGGSVGWATHEWRGQSIRSVIYPLRLIGAAHGVHLLQVAAPTEPIQRTLSQFMLLGMAMTVLATGGAYGLGWRLAGVALRPTREITSQAEAIEAGTLSERITAHADVIEFTRLVAVLNAMLNRLDRAFQSQQRFTADASHELRGPLNVLRGDIEVTLKRERSAPEYRETLERCREEVLRITRLASDLLVLARSDAGLPLEHRTEIDLHTLTGQIAERYRPLAAERNLRIHAGGVSAAVAGDAALLERVVANLMDNAVKYSSAGGAVHVDVQQEGGSAVVTVRDEGPGIPPEQVPYLFTRFFRGDPARPRAEGSGLGLAIAQAAAAAHGGRVEFLGNAPGAVFRVMLPLAGRAEAAAALDVLRPSRDYLNDA
jgi:two-component system OmpR family sensor kinase